jgi:hypothetical protein
LLNGNYSKINYESVLNLNTTTINPDFNMNLYLATFNGSVATFNGSGIRATFYVNIATFNGK